MGLIMFIMIYANRKKNIVETSFTYGDVGLDIKLLLKLVQEAEKNCKI